MAGQDLIVDESYWDEIDTFFHRAEKNTDYGIEQKLESYISKLKEIKETAIMGGSISEAVDAFIACAEKLQGPTTTITGDLRDLTTYFVNEIDEKDEYLF